MKRYNISVPKKYTKDGQEKTSWGQVGTLVEFEATSENPKGFILELNMFPETKFGVFEQKPKVDPTKAPVEYAKDEIPPDDIPF